MRKILIATPLKGDVPASYVRLLLELLANHTPEVTFLISFVSGTSVALARNELADYALRHDCDELLFWDKDLVPSLAQFHRLLSWDKDIVCTLYPTRRLSTAFHFNAVAWHPEPDAETGLVPVESAAIGFSKIKCSVFKTLIAANPDRRHWYQNSGEEGRFLHELFPSGIISPPTGPRIMLGEDYYFCHLARKAGLTIHLDAHSVIRHACDGIELPIATEQLKAMLAEGWRAEATPAAAP